LGGLADGCASPGDSLFSAWLARSRGAETSWFVDTGDYATRDMAAYRGLASYLEAKGEPVPPAGVLATLDGFLEYCGARYLTDGLASLRNIPSGSVDFIWSQAVLEHIRLREFDAFMAETRRILRPGGLCSHRIDLQDHLGAALNNLRFSERLWEADWFARSGFYTNRLRFSDLLRRFRAAGFNPEVSEIDRFPALPTPREKFVVPFHDLPEEELTVKGFDVVLRPI